MENNIGSYNVLVDFDNVGKKDRSEVRYSENDINSARIYVKCQFKEEDIDFTDCDFLIRTQAGENRIEDAPSFIDYENSIVGYTFPTNALITGMNHIEIMIIKGDWVKTSPKIYYRVFDGIGESDVASDVYYPILISLIKDVQNLGKEVQVLKDDVAKVNSDITKEEKVRIVNENERKSSELIRIDNEDTRIASELVRVSNENDRIANFKYMETGFNDSVSKVDNKISEVNVLKEEMVSVKNATEKVRVDTLAIKNETNTVKDETVIVKNATNTVKVETELVRNTTDSVRVATESVKNQAEAKIVDVEGRMKHIEDNFDSLVAGTGFASVNYVDNKVASIVNSAPEALDTLQELANALGNDPNFATTVMTEVGKKANSVDVYTKAETENLVNSKTQIDDNTESNLTVWSSSKTKSEIDKIATELNGTRVELYNSLVSSIGKL